VERVFLVIAALSGLLAVALGAFGAHALRERLASDLLDVFKTGVTYQMYHALALLAVALLIAGAPSERASWLSAAGWLFVVGSVLFSASLYVLSLTRRRWLGAITPLGGLAFVAGWLALALGAFR
jgi:uncharacterized membrane protein YgdD (TMEM256/DUF423 family)